MAFVPALKTSWFQPSTATTRQRLCPASPASSTVHIQYWGGNSTTLSLVGPDRSPHRKRKPRKTKQAANITKTSTKRKRRTRPPPQSKPSFSSQGNQHSNAILPVTTDYSDWSSDFLQLCNEQLNLLMMTVSNVDMVALFFRHENEQKGTLEFVPLIVHTSGDDEKPSRVWISSGIGGETELENAVPSRMLPGSVPANWLLPDYPFTSVAHHGGIFMSDGGLCVPVEYNDVVAGTIIMRPKLIASDNTQQWQRTDIERVAMVAKSIALAAALEGKWQSYKGLLGTSRTLLESARSLIRTTLHQIRSPLQALVTFGHLMMRKLPVKDSNRDLAKHVIVEALRLDDLLKPLDEARETFVLPEAAQIPTGRTKRRRLPKPTSKDSSNFIVDEHQQSAYKPINEGPQLLWLADMLQPQAERAELLATDRGITFTADIDDDAPPALTVEKFVREALSNLVDNAIKYTPKGSSMGISTHVSTSDNQTAAPGNTTGFVVWDTGYGVLPEEKEQVWEYGFRGSAAEKSGAGGTGFGLGITQQLIRSCQGRLELHSPLPPTWDPRDPNANDKAEFPGSAFIISLKRAVSSDD